MKFPTLIVALTVIFLTSCGGGSSPEKLSTTTPPRMTMSQRMDEKSGYKRDSNGNWEPQNDKRSPFESQGQDPNFAGKNFKAKAYKTGDYAKKSWWGNKEYDRKAYAGNTDAGRFQKASDLQGKGAREANTTADIPNRYKTGSYATNAAREASTRDIKKLSNDPIENRKKTFQQPEIIDWQEQRNLSLDQSKEILGH